MILEKININIREMKKSNDEIVVGTSTQVQLAREMGQKLNGVGMFLTKITNYKQKRIAKTIQCLGRRCGLIFIKNSLFFVNILL